MNGGIPMLLHGMNPDQGVILVAAFGNRLRGDDAFGGLVVDVLRGEGWEGVEVLDLTGSGPVALLEHLNRQAGLIVIDAVVGECLAPGEVLDVGWLEAGRFALAHERVCSTHGMSVGQQLEMASRLGLLPDRVRLIGTAASSCNLGEGASPEVARAVTESIEHIRSWLDRWGGRRGEEHP